jgi:hypothetical protein
VRDTERVEERGHHRTLAVEMKADERARGD